MKKYHLLFLAIFIVFYADAQEIERKHFVTYDIGALIPITSYTFGYNYQINKRFIVGVDYGFNATESDGRENVNTDFYFREFKIDGKFILNPNGRNKHFLALEYQNLYHKEILRNGIYFGTINNIGKDSKWWYAEGNYERKQENIFLGYGIYIFFDKKNRFGIMPEFKLGFKFRNTELTNVNKATEFDELPEEDQDRLGKEKFKILGTIYEHGGKTTKVAMDLSLKLFYNF